MAAPNSTVSEIPLAEPASCEVFHAGAKRIAALRGQALPAESVRALADTFKILGDQTRVRILDVLARDELCVCDIATLLGLTQSAVSHQLRLLRGMRVVRARRVGRMAFYGLDDQHIIRLFEDGLRHVEEAVSPAVVRQRSSSAAAVEDR
jgi:DNA-binding transcriptional ArsR family regulator